MNKYLLFMLATQCCSSCIGMWKSTYAKSEINIQDFASKRHELKKYKLLLGILDYILLDTLIQLSGCETVAQKSQRKQNRNYLKHGEEKPDAYDSIKTDFDTMLDSIKKIDAASQFLLRFMEQIINTQEYNSMTKRALENISIYTPRLYTTLKEAPILKEAHIK